ncbi:MAG: NAD-dependent epimerase/dehydratase family protein [Anaerolineales bacterium]|nr:NAD-dependent epimerase/dehydratase family protein [Anaerolineales bacterium]MDP7643107.1 NAD-dependent epimerase/dehydratase family protein [Anaerolineales bacterium]HJN40856.1 NAD-dependent epimerase/dehydratase family protein [Anaerolineales bacterium]
MRFLITGGAGFLGSALSNRLAAAGHEVRVIDDLSAGDAERLDDKVLFTRGDVNDRPKLWTLLQDVECVYHLAARVSVPQSVLYPREYNAVNVGGTVSVMEAMRDAGGKRVVLASSGAVYGAQTEQPLRESIVPKPDSPYAVSKLSAEYYVRTIGALWGLETVALRVFNAYGPGQPLPASHPPVVSRFLKSVASGGSLIVHGEGSQTRDYVFISDVIDALSAAATARTVSQLVINVGSGTAVSLNELVTVVGAAMNTTLEPLFNSSESGGVHAMCADLTLAAQKLGYRPRVSLPEGLRRTIATDERFQA